MKELRYIVGENLYKLRKSKGLTQLQISKELNYSDKAISRWERGDAMPDLESLNKISIFYNVPLDYMVKEHENIDEITELNNQQAKMEQSKRISIALLWVSVIWILVAVIYAYCEMFLNISLWQVFVWGVPFSVFIFSVFNRRWNMIKQKYILHSIFLWTLLLSIYLQIMSYNVWLIFIIGVPIQISLILLHSLKK